LHGLAGKEGMHGGKPLAGPRAVFLRQGGLDFAGGLAVLQLGCTECSCGAQKVRATAFTHLFDPHARTQSVLVWAARGGALPLAFDQRDGDQALVRPGANFGREGGSITTTLDLLLTTDFVAPRHARSPHGATGTVDSRTLRLGPRP